MRSFRSLGSGSSPAALPALLRASPALRRRRQGRGQDDGADRLRRERPNRTDVGSRRLEAVVTDGGTDSQGAMAFSPAS